jgi:hypothetical protein
MLRMQSFHHLRSPPRHTTFVRLQQHLRWIPRRDKPSRYGFLEKLHFGHTTRRPSGMIGLWARPIPSHHLGSSIGQAFQSHLFTFGHGWALGWAHPFPPHQKQYRTSFSRTSGGCIGQACHPACFRLRRHLQSSRSCTATMPCWGVRSSPTLSSAKATSSADI